MRETILVFDVGTSSVKATIFGVDGRLIASSSQAYHTSYPRPGWAQQDPNDFWHASVEAAKTLLATPDLDTTAIGAIGLAGHMNGALLVDGDGNPTYDCLIHADSRSTVQCDAIVEIWGQESIYQRTGNRMDEHLSLPKAAWIKKEEPSAFGRSAWLLNAKDYLRFKLTGTLGLTDYSDASLTGAFNQQRRSWDTEIVESAHIPVSMLPAVQSSVESGGVLSRAAAQVLGLKAGIPVSTGGGDAACATRGALVEERSQGYLCLGSSAWISTLSPSMVTDPLMRLQHFLDLEGELYNLCATVQSAASAVAWAREMLFSGQDPTVGTCSDGVLFVPYLMGERTPHWDALARGLFFGLSLSTTRQAMLRAVYEGVSFALCQSLQVYEALSIPLETLTLLGGATKDEVWQQLLSDVFARDLLLHPYPGEATGFGAALAAAVCIKAYPSLSHAIEAMQAPWQQVMHDRMRSGRYHTSYALYRDLYPAVRHLYTTQ
ncbi:MAG: FGGY family carbohydrate kinase [Sphaerochaeta sp.]|jgi:xylulokinase|nr:FGGY family carbohydrate kinase [Sphaerochaeta sp.]MDX9915100.1 FGGY family carbohydrate kinase [Sphaerochaeta sp.]